jgi:hypothetical protein
MQHYLVYWQARGRVKAREDGGVSPWAKEYRSGAPWPWNSAFGAMTRRCDNLPKRAHQEPSRHRWQLFEEANLQAAPDKQACRFRHLGAEQWGFQGVLSASQRRNKSFRRRDAVGVPGHWVYNGGARDGPHPGERRSSPCYPAPVPFPPLRVC